ncbi:MAG: helix-hairpin-helix domain-containing protein [Tepidisphaeraceae bacterium]
MQPWSSNPVKANVNTAAFPELFRAFWSVMAGNPSNATPFGTTGVDNYNIYDATAPTPSNPTLGNPQAMFRSPIRDPFGAAGTAYVSLLDAPNASGNVTNTNTMLLRAALAAVNTLGLRDNSQNVLSRTITLLKNSQINNGGSPPAPVTGTVELQVFSSAPQPVICEVYANTFTGPDSGTNTSNPQGYVAVELYNPYSVPMTLKNWQLGLINRSTSGGAYPYLYFQTNPPPATGTPPPVPPAGAVSVIGPMVALNNPIVDPKNGLYDNPVAPGTIYIPAHGYALLENYNGSGTGTTTANDATCRPVNALNPQPPTVPTTGGSFRMSAAPYTADQTGIWYGPAVPAGQTPTSATPPNTCDVYVPNLQLVIAGTKGTTITGTSTGGELVLLRPRRIDGTYSQSTGPDSVYNEGTTDASGNVTTVYLWDLVPVDSYDFTGLAQPAAVPYPVWSYVRVKGTLASNYFKQFFPGFYDAAKPMRQSYGTGAGAVYITAATVAGETPPWAAGDTPSFGVDASTASYNNPFPPVQIYNLATGNAAGDPMHFPNSVVSSLNAYPNGITPAATNLFPLGGFARNGDMLDIPFVGAYRIRISNAGALTSQVNTSNFLELNSLPMDCSLAAIETGINAEDAAQNIGRFIPMAASYQYVTGIQTGKFPDGTAATAPLSDYYAWARNFFNYLTVQSSTDTYLPNFDPNVASVNYAASPNNTFAYPPQNAATPIPPTPTLTASATAPDQTHQDNVGIEGLININTASWKVLSMLPFVPNNPAVDRLIAQNIVKYRLANGPFTSIFDLNQVTGFQNGTGVAGIPTAPTSSTGLLSPPDPNFGTSTAASTTPTGITEDYQWDCLTLSRISNLITTRSDTFTVYIEVQGWQNAGSTNASLPPQPMITRRYAFIVDRSAINGDPNSRFLKTVTVPND